MNLKKNSPESIKDIAKEISSKILEEITGEKLSNNYIKSLQDEISKNKDNKYL